MCLIYYIVYYDMHPDNALSPSSLSDTCVIGEYILYIHRHMLHRPAYTRHIHTHTISFFSL